MAGEYLPPVVTRLTGDISDLISEIEKAKAAMKSLADLGETIKINFEVNTASLARARTYARQLQAAMPPENIPINFDVNQASLARSVAAADAMAAATTRTTNAGRRWTGWLATAHNILTVFGANIVADTVGIVAFGIGATTAFAPVVEAVGNLGKTYAYLNPLQKVATVQITNFIHAFQNANQTGIFAVFTQLLDMVQGHINRTGGIMQQATIAFENFAAMLKQTFSSGPWQQMFSRSTGVIQQDLTALFRLFNALLNVLPALFHDFNGLGLWVLNGATAILHLIAVIGNANPGLMRFAAMTFLVYRALKMLGQLQQGSLLARGIQGIATALTDLGPGMKLFSQDTVKAYQGARLAGLGMGDAAMAATGLSGAMLGAVGGILAAAGAGIALGIALGKTTDPTQQMIDRLAQMDHATGDNVTGYALLSHQLLQYKSDLGQAASKTALVGQALGHYQQVQGDVSAAQQRAGQTAVTLLNNLGYLERTYHLTQQQAFQLAKATGVNLKQGFATGGGAAQTTRNKIAAYEQTVKAAQNPTSTLGYDLGLAANKALALDDRVTALTNAFNALLTPFANVIQDTVTWKTGNNQLEAAVDKAHGKVNALGNGVQRLAASALAQAITNTTNLSGAILQQTGSMQKAIGPVQREIGVLEALHSKSRVVTQAIRILERYINSLHSKTITITTNYVAYHSGVGGGPPAIPHSGYAAGTSSARPGWAMVGERGPELAYLRGGETIIPNHALRGYAAGTGGAAAALGIDQPINVYVDGKKLFEVMRERTFKDNVRTNNRTPRGSPVGKVSPR